MDISRLEIELGLALKRIGLRWTETSASEIGVILERAGLPDPVLASVLAMQIDDVLGPRFDELPTYPSVWELDRGDPYPVMTAPLDSGADRVSAPVVRRSPHPFASPVMNCDLRHLRFVPDRIDLPLMKLHWVTESALLLRPSDGTIATGHPNLSLAEFGQPGPVEENRFFGFPDRDVQHDDWLMAVAEQTMSSNIAVLPELSVDESLVRDVVDQWKSKPIHRRPFVFMPGSTHTSRDGTRVNRSEIHISGITDLIIVEKQECFRVDDRTEALDNGGSQTVDVHVVGGWRITGAIRRDALRPWYPELIAQLGVTLLLLPAMSPTTALFSQLNTIPARNWGIVVIANNPARWPATKRYAPRSPSQISVAWPIDEPHGLVTSRGSGIDAIRGTWRADMNSGVIEPFPLPGY